MIISLRVDDRLIHGQVAMLWTKEFSTTHIVVADDRAASDDVAQIALKMATPTGIKLLIKSVDDAIEVFNNPKAKSLKLFVLTSDITSALEVAKRSEVDSINIANVGRFNIKEGTHQVKLNSSILVSSGELTALKKLLNMNIPVYHQLIPSHPKSDLNVLINNIKEEK